MQPTVAHSLGRRRVLGSSSSNSQRCTVPYAHANWSDSYILFAASDRLNDAARRLRIKAKQLERKGASGVNQDASLAVQRLQLESQDALAAALKHMQAATSQEQYEEAARIRDESLAWLEGWHKPITPGSTRVSSLLHVSRQHSRWIGRWFTPADFLHHDMERNNTSSSSSQELNMQQLLQDPRYGTPLFEAFILPAGSMHAGADAAAAVAAGSSGQLPDSADAVHSSAEEERICSSNSSSYTSQTAALQSVQRAINEVLRVVPIRRPASSNSSSSGSQHSPVRVTNQRIMLLVDSASNSMFAASVNAGSDSTLLVWRMRLGDATPKQQQQQQQQPGTTSWPARPAESGNGAFRTTFTLDWHELDLLRGPGSIQRTGPSSFTFIRETLPEDVLLRMCGSNSISTDASSSSCSSSLKLYRLDLQYLNPTGAAADSSRGAAGVSSSTNSCDEPASQSWASRIAAELCHQLEQQRGTSTTSSSSNSVASVDELATLIAAAADGTAPPGAWVSERQQPVQLSEVALPGSQLAGAARSEAAQQEAEAVTYMFEKLDEQAVPVSFGGWVVKARLCC